MGGKPRCRIQLGEWSGKIVCGPQGNKWGNHAAFKSSNEVRLMFQFDLVFVSGF